MAYKKDQGRYARMTAFWALFLLAAYGCLGGLVISLRGWIGGEAWMDPLPLVGEVDTAKVVAIATLAAFGFALFRFLERPKVADMLIETEGGFDYTGADCQAWMRDAGFSETRVEPLNGPNAMVVGVK